MESHTEAEAKTKWCPFARVMQRANSHHQSGVTAVNRWGDDDTAKGTLCIASGCMLWQWDEREQAATVTVGMSQRDKIAIARGRAAGEPPKPERGYCGAAR